MTSEQMAEAIKREILSDVSAGIVPESVRDFRALHGYVDANCYGGTEAYLDAAGEEGFGAAIGIIDTAQTLVDEWIKAGGITEAEMVTA